MNNQTGDGVAIKKVTNVFSKKILAKRALREIKLLQHFRGHRNVGSPPANHTLVIHTLTTSSGDIPDVRIGLTFAP